MMDPFKPFEERFGETFKRDEALARHTVARLGGPADAVITAHSTSDLIDAVKMAHQAGIPWMILGGGSNVLAADQGYRGVVIINHAKLVRFEGDGQVFAESGMSLSTLARKCMSQGLGGLEWGVNVPGTMGGAVINNAGAHGGDMAQAVKWVELFSLYDEPHTEMWNVEQMKYAYRYSALKGQRVHYVVLGTTLVLEAGCDPAALNAKADEFVAHRKRTQPPGASLGSIFKNPPGDYAGRLIEAAGLKGTSIGGVQISPIHGNFFVNTGNGTAADYFALIEKARDIVQQKFGITLELEIERIGDW